MKKAEIGYTQTINKNGQLENSSNRLMTLLWFFLSLPMLYILIAAVYKIVTTNAVFTWEKAILLISIFLIILAGWIAPKAIAKATEENGLLESLINLKRNEPKE